MQVEGCKILSPGGGLSVGRKTFGAMDGMGWEGGYACYEEKQKILTELHVTAASGCADRLAGRAGQAGRQDRT